MGLKLSIQNKQNKIGLSRQTLKQIILATFKNTSIKKPREIDLLFTNDREIKELNLQYLGKNCPTDVIAFDVSIAVSVDTAIRNAKIYKTSPIYELYLYVAHGMLHILGYNDNTPKQQKFMQDKVERILKCLSIKPKP